MFLHGKDSARIEWGDTLNTPKLVEGDSLMKFDIVVANPPFSLDKWGAENAEADRYKRFHRGLPPKSKADYAFITHMIETAVEASGKVGVIAPHGVLFRRGSEGNIRRQLVEENLLDAVIGLPANLFFGTPIPAAILIFKRSRRTRDILFVDASRERDNTKGQFRLRAEDITKVCGAYEAFTTSNGYACLATADRVRENDYNLNVSLYVETYEVDREVDMVAIKREIEDLEGQLAETRQEMDRYLAELGVYDQATQ
jgi:type I restriction enzyme M protein